MSIVSISKDERCIVISPTLGEVLAEEWRRNRARWKWKDEDHARRYEKRYGRKPLGCAGFVSVWKGFTFTKREKTP